jgi:hypothetical protein
METGDDQQQQDTAASDESVEEFKQEIENDPSTADASDVQDDDAGRLRGG